MGRTTADAYGSIAVLVTDSLGVAEHDRVADVVKRLARELSTERNVGSPTKLSFPAAGGNHIESIKRDSAGNHFITLRAPRVRIAYDVWALCRDLCSDLVRIDRGIRIGVHASAEESSDSIQVYANDLAHGARNGGIALSRALAHVIQEPTRSEFEQDRENDAVFHYPAIVRNPSLVATAVDRYVARAVDDHTDDCGFLVVPSDRVRLVGDLVHEPRALILGSPWMGKSWIAARLAEKLERLGETVWIVDLGNPHGPWLSEVEWERWRLSHKHAYVILDALDEAIDRDYPLQERLKLLRQPGMHQSRLHVLVFSRPTHRDSAARALNWAEHLETATWHLQPLDPSAAARYLSEDNEDPASGSARVNIARGHVRRLSAPGLVRNLLVLSELAQSDGALSVREIEERVLDRLCWPKLSEIDAATAADRRRAAARIAAVLQFSNREWIDLRRASVLPVREEVVGLVDAFPGGLATSAAGLERAARAVATGGLFEEVEGRGHRFALQFAKEWLAADALRDVPLSLVRQLTTGPRGGAQLLHRQVVERLAASRPDVVPLLHERAAPLPRSEATELLERMLAAAAGGVRFWNLRSVDDFSALADPEIANRIAAVLRDATQTDAKRLLALDIATQNAELDGWQEMMVVIVELALDSASSFELRKTAVSFVCNRRVAAPLRSRLEPILRETTDTGAVLRSDVLHARLRDGGDVLTIARVAPPRDAGHLDARALLFHAIAERLDGCSARRVVDEHLGLARAELPQVVREELFEPAFELWLASVWSEEDVPRIVAALERPDYEAWRLLGTIQERCRKDQALRRSLFQSLVDKGNVHLAPSDASWLTELVEQKTQVSPSLFARAHDFARTLSGENEHRTRLLAALSRADSSLLLQLERKASEEEGWRERLRQRVQRDREQPAVPRRFVGDVVQEVLAAGHAPSSLIQTLGCVLFVREWRPKDLYGTFDELTSSSQCAALDALTCAFATAAPTAGPANSESGYSTLLRYESAAFSAAVLLTAGDWLTEEIVRVWLASVLSVHDQKQRNAVVAACYERAPHATRDALLEAIGRDRWAAGLVGDLPAMVLRDTSFVSAILDIAADPTHEPSASRLLIWALAGRVGAALAGPLATSRLWQGDLALVVSATLAFLNEGQGIEAVLARAQDDASFLAPLSDRFDSPWPVTLKRWGTPPLAELAAWLLRRIPVEEDEIRLTGRNISDISRMKLEDLRAQAVDELLGRDDPAAESECRRLALVAPAVAPWFQRVRSAREVDRVLAGIDPVAARLTPREVVTALESGYSSRLRSANDLFHVLVDLLAQIEGDCAEGTTLVWHTADGPEEHPGDQPNRRKRRAPAEKRLVRYVRTRVKDLVSCRFGNTVHFPMEVTEAHDDRPDVLATVLSKAPEEKHATVAVEYKWSHDKRVIKDLTKLAKRYVVDQHRGHGIYVVGYSGRVRVDRAALARELNERAQRLEEELGVRLHVQVLPFLRPPEPPTARGGVDSPSKRRPVPARKSVRKKGSRQKEKEKSLTGHKRATKAQLAEKAGRAKRASKAKPSRRAGGIKPAATPKTGAPRKRATKTHASGKGRTKRKAARGFTTREK